MWLLKKFKLVFLCACILGLTACTVASSQKIEMEVHNSIKTGEPEFFVTFGPDTQAMFSDWSSKMLECLVSVEKTDLGLRKRSPTKPTHIARVKCPEDREVNFYLRRGWGQYAGKFHITGYVGGSIRAPVRGNP